MGEATFYVCCFLSVLKEDHSLFSQMNLLLGLTTTRDALVGPPASVLPAVLADHGGDQLPPDCPEPWDPDFIRCYGW